MCLRDGASALGLLTFLLDGWQCLECVPVPVTAAELASFQDAAEAVNT